MSNYQKLPRKSNMIDNMPHGDDGNGPFGKDTLMIFFSFGKEVLENSNHSLMI